jgi:hypothetical protein
VAWRKLREVTRADGNGSAGDRPSDRPEG